MIFPNDAVFRKQLAALDPSDGRALAWDPGSNAFLGTFDLTVIDRGLLAGMDRNRYNQRLTGRSGFFDFGGFTTNEPPVAVDDTGSMPQDSTATFNVLSNDSDPDGDALTLTISSPPAAVVGTATLVNGEIQFAPAAGSTATAVIGYTITDGNGGTDSATLTVTVTGVNTAMSCSVSVNANNVPVVSYSGFPNNKPNVNILRNGGWIATDTSATPGAGTYADTSAVPGVAYSYVIRSRPGGGVVNDVACSPANAANQPPVAVDDTGSMPQDSTATFDVLSNDSDPDGDALTLTISSPPASVVGTATLVNGEIQFAPAAGSTATAVIGYTITDGNGGTDSATLTVTVTGVNTAMSCSVSVNANNVPVVSYSGFPNNKPNVNILRNGGWIATDTSATPGAGTYADTSAVPGVAYSYVIRSRPGGGVVNDVACSPAAFIF